MNENSTVRVNDTHVSEGKKPYRTPRLTEYGHISKLTAGTTGSFGDKGSLANQHGQG